MCARSQFKTENRQKLQKNVPNLCLHRLDHHILLFEDACEQCGTVDGRVTKPVLGELILHPWNAPFHLHGFYRAIRVHAESK